MGEYVPYSSRSTCTCFISLYCTPLRACLILTHYSLCALYATSLDVFIGLPFCCIMWLIDSQADAFIHIIPSQSRYIFFESQDMHYIDIQQSTGHAMNEAALANRTRCSQQRERKVHAPVSCFFSSNSRRKHVVSVIQ